MSNILKPVSQVVLLLLVIWGYSENCFANYKKSLYVRDYLAVQFSKDGYWSIVDKDGKIVVKEGYSPKELISSIYDGVYWVKNNGKYQLYNIALPNKPVNNEEFDMVTEFLCGYATVSRKGHPIQIVDTKGLIVATLPDSIISATSINHMGYFVASSYSTGSVVDYKGNFIIQGKMFATIYEDVIVYSELDEKEYVKTADMYGNKLGKFSSFKWGGVSLHYSEGKLAVYECLPNSVEPIEDAPITIIDAKGQKLFNINKSFAENSKGAMYLDGLIVYRAKDNMCGVADDKGEDVIRPKYNQLVYIGDSCFIARKSNGYGIIDKEENIIVPLDYDMAFIIRLGDNFLMRRNNLYYIVDTNGKEVNKEGFSLIAPSLGINSVYNGQLIEQK